MVSMTMGLLAAKLRVEFGFYKLTQQMEVFINIWVVNNVLCSIREDSLGLHF